VKVGRYRKAGREHKRKLLDQAQELLGYHRKSAVRVLGAPEVAPVPWINAGRPVSYEPRVLLPWLRHLDAAEWLRPFRLGFRARR
jgi:hypothetical protein